MTLHRSEGRIDSIVLSQYTDNKRRRNGSGDKKTEKLKQRPQLDPSQTWNLSQIAKMALL